jgi:hypothetical protein
MDIAADSNVLRHPIPDLATLFQNRDIEKDNSNLTILTIRVINDGEANIHDNDFDSPMGFGLQETLVEPDGKRFGDVRTQLLRALFGGNANCGHSRFVM